MILCLCFYPWPTLDGLMFPWSRRIPCRQPRLGLIMRAFPVEHTPRVWYDPRRIQGALMAKEHTSISC
jgi:hypothetical protein